MTEPQDPNWLKKLVSKGTGPEWEEFIRNEQREDEVKTVLLGPNAHWQKTSDHHQLVIPQDTTDVTPQELETMLKEWGIKQVRIGELVDIQDETRHDLGISIALEDFAAIAAQRDYSQGLSARK
jgi:hypothetical protein